MESGQPYATLQPRSADARGRRRLDSDVYPAPARLHANERQESLRDGLRTHSTLRELGTGPDQENAGASTPRCGARGSVEYNDHVAVRRESTCERFICVSGNPLGGITNTLWLNRDPRPGANPGF